MDYYDQPPHKFVHMKLPFNLGFVWLTQPVSQVEVILNEEYPPSKILEATVEAEPTQGPEMGSPLWS